MVSCTSIARMANAHRDPLISNCAEVYYAKSMPGQDDNSLVRLATIFRFYDSIAMYAKLLMNSDELETYFSDIFVPYRFWFKTHQKVENV